MKVQPIFSTPDDKSPSAGNSLQSQQFDQRAASKPSSSSFSTFYGCFRYFVLMLGTLCMTSTTSNMISLNFTFICMAPQNGTTSRTPTVDYSLNQKSLLMLSVAVGSMAGTFPYNWLYSHYGAKLVLFSAGVMSVISTALVPAVAISHFAWLLVLRVIQGIAFSANFGATGCVGTRWASLKQNAFFLSVLTCYSTLSMAITNPIAGLLCESSFGWPAVFYSNAGVCAVLFCFWIVFYRDHPRACKFVSSAELEKINRGKSQSHINMDTSVPYMAILRTPLFWIIWLNAFGNLFSSMFLLSYQPSYFHNVLRYSVSATGFISSLPPLLHIPLRLIFGYSSDKFNCVSERMKMLVFNGVGVGLPGLCFLAMGFVSSVYAVILFLVVYTFYATVGGGYYKCSAFFARQYNQFIISNIEFIRGLSLLIGPAVMTVFVKDESDQGDWRNVFIVLAVIMIVASILFCKFATDKPAEFTKRFSSSAATSEA